MRVTSPGTQASKAAMCMRSRWVALVPRRCASARALAAIGHQRLLVEQHAESRPSRQCAERELRIGLQRAEQKIAGVQPVFR